MDTNNILIRKMFNGLMIINSISLALNIMCTVIDSIVTGRFLGADAVTAAGLVQPVIMLVNTIGMLLGPGLGIMVTRYMGKAETDRIDQVFSLVMYATTALSFILTVVLWIGAPSIATALGSRAGDTVVALTTDYLRGFSYGIIPMRVGMTIMGVMTIDNDKERAIGCMAVTLVCDVAFDLANVLIFHGGMYGMALASAGSYLFAMLYVFTHFRKKDRILHFTSRGLKASDLKDVALCGIPSLITMGGQTFKGFSFNAVLLAVSGSAAVAALQVCNSSFSLFVSVMAGIYISASILSSMLYGEEDRNGLVNTLKIALKLSYTLMTALMLLVFILAKPMASMFLKADTADSAEILTEAVRLIRFSAVQIILISGSYAISGVYQGTGRLRLNYLTSLLRDCVFPVLTAYVLGYSFGLAGFEAGYIVSGLLVFASSYTIAAIVNKRFSIKAEDLILLPDDFGAKPEESYEVSLNTIEKATDVSQHVMQFCRERGADEGTAFRYSLFIEEIACNTIEHGFEKTRHGSLDIRVVYNDDKNIIRFRDNGRPFDPNAWIRQNHPDDPLKGAGIRIVVGMAEEVRHIPAMGLNNLLVIVNPSHDVQDPAAR